MTGKKGQFNSKTKIIFGAFVLLVFSIFTFREVNTACPYFWEIGPYGPCGPGCGASIQSRTVVCKDHEGNEVADSLCEGAGKPALDNTRACFSTVNCSEDWVDVWREPALDGDPFTTWTCDQVCTHLGKSSTNSPDGFDCASGEVRPVSANVALQYRFGIWGSGEAPPTIDVFDQGAQRCYRVGQKHDDDSTDTVIGCHCE